LGLQPWQGQAERPPPRRSGRLPVR
jgi:hypothetical protein